MKPFFSVFTPTFNRAELIGRVYESLMRQSFTSFEWIVVDDGSTDDTESVVSAFAELASFPVRYFKTENRGKVAAINYALDYADGVFFLVFDSDDWCTEDALQCFYDAWEKLSSESRSEYGAISCLKKYANEEIVGEDYSRIDAFGCSYIDRFNLSVLGDKWECILTEVHKSYRYDLAVGERYQAPEYAWLKMAEKYNTIFLNKALSVVEYQDDGISRNNLKHRSSSPVSTQRFYALAVSVSRSFFKRCKSQVNYCRFGFHAGDRMCDLKYFPFSLFGFFMYLADKFRLAKRRR